MEQPKNKAKASIIGAVALAVTNYFAQVNAKKEVYSTADGFLFENLGFAKNHAATLKDKNVTPHINSNKSSELDDLDEDDDQDPASGAASTQLNK